MSRIHGANTFSVILFSLLICISAFSQTNDQETGAGLAIFRFQHLTSQNGFPAASVLCLTQDDQGFIWFGTYEGLFRFDGYSYKPFQNITGDNTSLSAMTIGALLIAKDGTLWVATLNGGVNAFDQKTERFTRYMHDDEDPGSLLHNRVNALLEDDSGNIWAGTDGGLDCISPADGMITHMLLNTSEGISPGINRIQCITKDEQGNLWIGTGGGLVRLDPATGKWVVHTYNAKDPDSLADNGVLAIVSCPDKGFWIGTNNGLDFFDPEKNKFIHYRHEPGNSETISDNKITALYQTDNEHLWIGTNDKGFNLLNPKTGGVTRIPSDSTMPTHFWGSWITGIYEDSSGMLWISTLSGVNILDLMQSRFEQYRHDPANPGSLSITQTWTVMEDSYGSIWVGTMNGGLNRLDEDSNGNFMHYRNNPNDPYSLGDDRVFALAEDVDGSLLIGTMTGLQRFDRTSGRFHSFPGLPAEWIASLHVDRKGRIWIGYFGNGLFRIESPGAEPVHYTANPITPGGISGNRILSIAEDPDGIIWFGTFGSGINRLNPENEIITSYRFDQENPDSIATDQTGSIYFDHTGTMWCATSAGLDRFDPVTQSFRHYRTDNGLPSNNTVSIVEEKPNILWIGTLGGGISRFDTETESFINYDEKDGLTGNNFLAGGALLSRTGKIYFAGSSGLNAFYPDQIYFNRTPPPVVLTDFLLFNCSVPIGGEESPLTKGINETDEIKLHQSHSMFSFEFSALNYRFPEKNRYAYKLEGFDTDWNYVDSSRRFATYTNLDAGTYTFRVRASNNDGIWNEQGKDILVTITPYWWKTWWFRIFCILSAGVIITMFLRSRLKLLHQRLRNVEIIRESETRYRELADSITDVFFALDNDFRCTYWNKATEAYTGIPSEQAVGKRLTEIYPESSESAEIMKVYSERLYAKREHTFIHTYTLNNEIHTFENTVYFPRSGGISVFSKHINDRIEAEDKIKKTLAEKEILLQELYHRTRNNMQIIQSMLMLHAANSKNEQTDDLVHEMINKIYSMSLVHQMLYNSYDLSHIDLFEYCRELTSFILDSYKSMKDRITLHTEGSHFTVFMDTAIPFGLIINELMSNALKHAFPDGSKGSISIHIEKKNNGEIQTIFADNGTGPPAGIDLNHSDSLGIVTITNLVREQLQGQIRFEYQNGVNCIYTFADNLYSRRL